MITFPHCFFFFLVPLLVLIRIFPPQSPLQSFSLEGKNTQCSWKGSFPQINTNFKSHFFSAKGQILLLWFSMCFLTVSKMWFVKWLWRDLYFRYMVITAFFSYDHQILCFTFIKAWQRDNYWDGYFAIKGEFYHRAIWKKRCAFCPENYPKSGWSFQPALLVGSSHPSEHLCADLSPTVSSAIEKKQSHQVWCAPLNWVVGRLSEAGRLLWDWI